MCVNLCVPKCSFASSIPERFLHHSPSSLVHFHIHSVNCEAFFSFFFSFFPAPSFCFPFHGFSNQLGCPRVSLTGLARPPRDAEGCLLIRAWCLVYSLSSAQGWRFCRAYREELWAHSGSDTADSLRDFWRADCCSCRMRRLAC